MFNRIIKNSIHTWCVKARDRMWVWAFVWGVAGSQQRRARSAASLHPLCGQQTSCNRGLEPRAAPGTEAAWEDSHRPGGFEIFCLLSHTYNHIYTTLTQPLSPWSGPGHLLCTTSGHAQAQPSLFVQKHPTEVIRRRSHEYQRLCMRTLTETILLSSIRCLSQDY